ncbi:hypothetical protein [Streptomyces pseudovenezuelae]|uniref:hypothetical protein n=1 Tax=Streptomyces pseudovenezuelae TaxID=67350 RepID=UPI002E8189B7|nr:hypothetical protein [Streptomyces pseudovenezuelae]WUA88921.1 hypothetical protein OHO81_17160 [Streptomyces pseudovenezuelae]
MKTFRYRKRSPIGGLLADITAEAETFAIDPRSSVQIHGKIWLELPESPLHWREVAWMAYGLSLHSERLNEMHPQGLIVKVHSLSFPLSDYVPEVAALAMEGWVREEFELTAAGISMEYDPENCRYVFSLADGEIPFSDKSVAVPVFHAW